MTKSGQTETTTFVADAVPKPATSKWKSFGQFMYNSDNGTVLGRSGKSWLQITIFYLIFYGVLAAFFAVLLILFLQTLDPNEPRWKTDNGIIGNYPGMGFRPVSTDSGSTLIWLKRGAADEHNQKYVDSTRDFLAPYEPGQQQTEHFMDCTSNNRPKKDDKKTCKFRIESLGPCTKENRFGYDHGQPCVLLKLNKIFGWTPEVYEPTEIPEELSTFYHKQTNKTLTPPVYDMNQVYVTCDGEDNVDKEHIGPIALHPQSFPVHYFPYSNSPGYLAPVVMVEFLNPSAGVLINVECKAWAKNIMQSRTDRLGMVHFELLVDR